MIRSLALSLIPSSARYAATPIHRLFLYFAHQYSDRHHLHQPLWNMLITIINQYSHGPDTLGLFEPDKDNDHIENILLAQLICSLIKDSMSSVHKQSLAKQATIELSALVSSNTRALSSDLPLSDGLIEAMFISMIAVIAVGGEIGAVLSDIIPSLCKYPILNHAINHNYLFLLDRSLN
uniref:Uncharacterized protein n=2 Tax=Spongospora subterranea TaxID=70186 RepID=A0A0H5R3M4_9EUKA|eukprot:CRZ02634.1 hypothetical protein [Spongospora subterranea]